MSQLALRYDSPPRHPTRSLTQRDSLECPDKTPRFDGVPERHAMRKPKRRATNGVCVLEGGVDVREPVKAGGKRGAPETKMTKQRTFKAYRRLNDGSGRGKMPHDRDAELAQERIRTNFAEDFFLAKSSDRPSHFVAELAATAPKPTEEDAGAAGPRSPGEVVKERGPTWLRFLEYGFSVLVEGVGSKRQVLETFADKVLMPWGACVVRINGFQKRLSLSECLRDIIERLHPGTQRMGNSAEALAATLSSLRRNAAAPIRPLCLVVHNVECLPQAQQAILAGLGASQHIHLVASVDSMWAALVWTPKCLKDFNFCHEEVHTYDFWEVPETNGRFARGRPGWCDASNGRRRTQKAGLGLVLRSLTNSHRELIQAIAQHQLESGGGRTGMSMSKLLGIASDRMIASTVTKLKSLLNELKDHDVVAQKTAQDGGTIYHLPCDEHTLQRLSQGLPLEESDVEDDEDSDFDEA